VKLPKIEALELNNKRACIIFLLTLIIFTSSLLIIKPAYAQVSTPPAVETLGPVDMFYYGSDNAEVTIISPAKGSSNTIPFNITFIVSAKGWFGQFGNIGMSLENGAIHSVTDFTSKHIQIHQQIQRSNI
jgi:hypothetical protein